MILTVARSPAAAVLVASEVVVLVSVTASERAPEAELVLSTVNAKGLGLVIAVGKLSDWLRAP